MSSKTAINLTGNALAQTVGNSGASRVDGCGATDTLTGLAGDDTLDFSTTPAVANIDLITDFGDGSDRVELKSAVFTALSVGTPAASAYAANTSGHATTAAQRIICETDTGFLFQDEDGTGTTGHVQFASLTLGPHSPPESSTWRRHASRCCASAAGVCFSPKASFCTFGARAGSCDHLASTSA